MHFHKAKYDAPCNFRHFGLMLYHHLIPVDERLEEKKYDQIKKKKREKDKTQTATSGDTDPSTVATGMMTMMGLF